MNKNIGEFIKYVRKLRDITQKQLGDKLGIDAKVISKWESGVYLPDITMLISISEELGITVDELLRCELKEQIIVKEEQENINLFETRNNPKKNHKIIMLILIFIIVLISFTCLFIKLAKSKKEEILNNDIVNVYKISSDDEDIFIDGYIIQNNNSYLTIINKLRLINGALAALNIEKNDSLIINLGAEKKYFIAFEKELDNMLFSRNNYCEFEGMTGQFFYSSDEKLEAIKLIIMSKNEENEKGKVQFELKLSPYFA